jgi:hypothetical protein
MDFFAHQLPADVTNTCHAGMWFVGKFYKTLPPHLGDEFYPEPRPQRDVFWLPDGRLLDTGEISFGPSRRSGPVRLYANEADAQRAASWYNTRDRKPSLDGVYPPAFYMSTAELRSAGRIA